MIISASPTDGTVDFVGEVTRKKNHVSPLFERLSVPTVYHEAKGLYVLEALACGVPVVQPRHGSFPELIEATGGGILYDPEGGIDALAIAIAELMDDPAKRRDLALRGWKSVHALFTDKIMAEQTWALYERYRNERRSIR